MGESACARVIQRYIDDLIGLPADPFSSFYRRGDYSRDLFGIAKGYSMNLRGYKLDPIAYVVAKKAGAIFSDEIHPKFHVGQYPGKEKLLIDVYNEDSECWCITISKIEGTLYSVQIKCYPQGWTVTDYRDADKDLSGELVKDSRFMISNDEEAGACMITLSGKDMIETGTELLKEVVRNLYVSESV